MAYADRTDVEAGFRALTEPEGAVVDTLLNRAGLLLLARVPSIPRRIASGSLSEAVVVAVEAAMVERVLRNPDGKRQMSTSIDDYTHSWTVDAALSTGGLFPSEAELSALVEASGGMRIGSVRLGIGMPP